MYEKKKTKISDLSNRLLSQNNNDFNESQFIDNDYDDEDENNEDYDSDDENNSQKKVTIKNQHYRQRVTYSQARLRSFDQDIRNRISMSMPYYFNDNSQNTSQSSDQIKANQDSKKFSFEQFLEKVGTENWYQIRLFSCFCLQWFVVGWFMISQNFLFQRVKYQDHYSSIKNVENMCLDGEFTMSQTKQLLLPNQFYSITVEFGLYCKNEYLRKIMLLAQPVFGILGYLFFGYLSDNFGRKHSLKLAWKIFAIGLIIQCSTQVLPLVMSGYCISAFGALSVIIIQISLINEQASNPQY